MPISRTKKLLVPPSPISHVTACFDTAAAVHDSSQQNRAIYHTSLFLSVIQKCTQISSIQVDLILLHI